MTTEKKLSIPMEKKKLSDMNPAPYNPKSQNEVEKAGLERSLKEFGYVEPIVWNKRTKNIVDGHQRYDILLEKDVEEVDVVVIDVPLNKEKQLNIALGNKHIAGSYMQDKLQSLLREIQQDDNAIFQALNMNDLKILDWAPLPEVEGTPQLNIPSTNIVIVIPEKAKYLKDAIIDALLDFISDNWSGNGIKVK